MKDGAELGKIAGNDRAWKNRWKDRAEHGRMEQMLKKSKKCRRKKAVDCDVWTRAESDVAAVQSTTFSLIEEALSAHAQDVQNSLSSSCDASRQGAASLLSDPRNRAASLRCSSCPDLKAAKLERPSLHLNPYTPSGQVTVKSGHRASSRPSTSGIISVMASPEKRASSRPSSSGLAEAKASVPQPLPLPSPPSKICKLPPSPTSQLSRLVSKPQRKLRVAVFNACKGYKAPHPAATSCLASLLQTPWFHSKAVARLLNSTEPLGGKRRSPLSWLSPVEASLVNGDGISSGRLVRPNGFAGHGFDVLIVPGGSTRADMRTLGKEGRAQIIQFVQSGGGYCGICAGAFLGLRHLGLVEARPSTGTTSEAADESDDEGQDAEPTEKSSAKPASRDPLTVDASFSKLGRRLLWYEGRRKGADAEEGADGMIEMRYHNGPLVKVPEGSMSHTLCRMYPKEFNALKAPEGLSGAAAVVMQDFGGGRAVIISPHPESTQEAGFGSEPGKVRLRRVLQRAVLIAAAGPDAHSWIEHTCHLPG